MVIGIKEIWPDLVLRHILMWDLEPQSSPNVHHSTMASPSGEFFWALCVSVVQKHIEVSPQPKLEDGISYPSALSPFVELAGYVRFCCYCLRRQERRWNMYPKPLGHS